MATAVTIQILVDNVSALTNVDALSVAMQQSGVAAQVASAKLGTANTDATAKLKQTAAAGAALEQQMRQVGMASVAAATGIQNTGQASVDAAKRMATANGEMQQMMLNIQAAQEKYARVKPPPRPTTPLGESFANLGTLKGDMDNLGTSFANLPRKIQPAEEEVSRFGASTKGHMSTGLDAVRLLSQEFGLRLPRAIEAMLSRMPSIVSALSSVLGVMAGIAAAEVFVHLAEEGYKLYEQYISLNAQADKFYETLKKTKEQDIPNTRSIETTKQRGGDATETYAANYYASQSKERGTPAAPGMLGLGGWAAGLISAHQLGEKANDAAAQMSQLDKVSLDQARQMALAKIETAHASDGILQEEKKINAELQKKIEINATNRKFDRESEKQNSNPSPQDAGAEQERLKNQQAEAEAATQKALLGREASLAIMKAQHETAEAGLQDDALYVRKRLDGVQEITKQLQNQGKGAQQIAAETAAFTAKLDAEHSQKIKDQMREADSQLRDAQAAGLTGGARISADLTNTNSKLDEDPHLNAAPKAKMKEAAAVSADQKMRALEDSFADHVKQLEDQKLAASQSGFAKIDAEARSQVDALNKLYRDDFQNAQLSDTQKLQSAKNLNDGVSAIQTAADAQRKQLRDRNAADDLQYADEASRAEARVKEDGLLGWVSAYKNSIAAINDDDAKRTAKMMDEATRQGLSQDEVSQRKVDIDRQANAEIAQQNQELQHKIAGTLQQAFTDPVDFIKQAMEKMMFEILASWVMRMQAFKTLFGSTMGSLQPGAPTGATGAGGLMGTIMSGTAGVFGGHPSIASVYGPTSSTNDNSAGGTISAADSGTRSIGSSVSSSSSTPAGGLGSVVSTIGGLDRLGSMIPSAPVAGTGGVFAGDPSIGSEADASAATGAALNAQNAPQGLAGTASAALGYAGAGMGAYTAYQSTVGAFESDSPLKGALGDAAAGAAIGSLGGPLGTAIGAGVGAAVGAAAGLLGMVTGEGGKLSARKYYEQSVLPTLQADLRNAGGADYQSAISNANKTSADAMSYMRLKFGSDAANWVDTQYMRKELQQVTSTISNAAEGGRQYTKLSASQFHTGGRIDGFGSFGTSSNEGFIHAMLGETVMTPQATSLHAPMLSAMNSGASASDIASAYLAGSPSPSSNSGATEVHHHLHVHTLDTKTMSGWLKGGGAQMITKHQNDLAGQYAGDGIGG